MKVRRIDFSPDEWLAGTVGMSAVDLGVYWQACALIYSRDGPIADDLIIRAIADDPRRIRNAIERLVARDKLQRSGSQLSNRRCIDELQVSRRRIASAAQNGRSGGRPSNKINGVEKAPGYFPEKLTINHQEEDSVSSLRSETARAAPVDALKEMFDVGVRVLTGRGVSERQARSLVGKARKDLRDDGRLMAILLSVEREAPVDAIGYFEAAVIRSGNGHARDFSTGIL
jgi:uncharacterized protein YdaU (DUF1376 family)